MDASIAPVSVSDPSAEAAEALRLCQVLDNYGSAKISGMGKIAHARDAVRYAAFTGLEPEIKTDAPAWLVTFKGELAMPMSREIWIDPTCIVVGGSPMFYATGPVRSTETGAVLSPLPAKQKAEFALPPLSP